MCVIGMVWSVVAAAYVHVPVAVATATAAATAVACAAADAMLLFALPSHGQPSLRAGSRVLVCLFSAPRRRVDGPALVVTADVSGTQERRIPFAFLEDIKNRFKYNYGDRGRTAIAFQMNDDFGRDLQVRLP